MEICLIGKENCKAFAPVMTKNVYDALFKGYPLLALGLVDDDTAIGAVAGYEKNERFYVQSLFVQKDKRRQGGGSMLLQALSDILDEEADDGNGDDENGIVDAIRISFTITDEESETLEQFLTAQGFIYEDHDGENIYVIPLSEAGERYRKIFRIDRLASKRTGIRSFAECNEIELMAAERQARQLSGLVPEGGFLSPLIEPELSFMELGADGALKGFCVVDYSVLDMPTYAAAWSEGGNPISTGVLLFSPLRVLLDEFPDDLEDTYAAIPAVTQDSIGILKKFFPDAFPLSRTYYRGI